MTAKSLPNVIPNMGRVAQWSRNAVSLVVLAASLAALFLILAQQHGHVFKQAYARMNPVELFQLATRPAPVPALPVVTIDAHRQRAVADFLAKRYRVASDVARDLVGIAHAAGEQFGLDPLLILAVMAVESGFNPIAESVVGAKGLMQIMTKYHADKLDPFGGEQAVLDPKTNILVGAEILREYIRRTGNLSTALQMYAGALSDEKDVYTHRVMSEKQRLQRVVAQVPSTRVRTLAMGERLDGALTR